MMNNYVDLIKLNNDIEKIKFFRDNANTSLQNLESIVGILNSNYKSNFNKVSSSLVNISINNKRIIVYQFNRIKFLEDKLDKYKLTSLKSKQILGE